ncbi:DUF6248 family natural product biosynthesis protein [Streptomyces beihaiensis]|uniref:DUF6248 family natural product biosynthesis protein n=1 Tax=Streptomyces beihaiensis TaxID=2984495 RepID=A0ABT3TR96_9ACTN|nr:DUF6248 family natural product biosynthesis protein [Streptomyces beihaiensis]MCX3059568.1 DUF6248 family natural product biosynthesis protein [Streptomyces beihaiensis]
MSAPIRRPQRKLTDEDFETINRAALLNLHGALIMGIVDPVPNPSPMSEAEGAWVREHVWPEHFREIDRKYPFGFQRWSMCERGTCWNCLNHRCDLCVHRQEGGPAVDDNTDWVWAPGGFALARLIVRPGGEPCVWWCRCPCPKTGEAPAKPERRRTVPQPAQELPPPRPAPAVTRRAPDTHPALFDVELMPQ